MPTFTPVYELPLNPNDAQREGPYESFYIPRFEVKLAPREGVPPAPLPLEVVRDVIQVTYKDNVNEIDSFDLVISNYESDFSRPDIRIRTKYEPPSREEFAGLFDPGAKIELWMGYGDNLHLMLTGEIHTLEPSFSAGGLTLSVRGLNVLHKFRAKQHTKSWDNTKDSVIAQEIGRNPVTDNRPGINFAVRVDPTAQGAEIPDRYVLMNNQYDIVFLMERARRRDYEVVLVETNEQGEPDPHLYFGPSQNPTLPNLRLEWGRSLVSFRPTLTTANQVSKVVVLGWDRERNRQIRGEASWESQIPRRNSAERARQQQLARAFGNREEVITDRPVYDQRHATDLAEELLRDLRKGMVEASGETVGLPALRAGRKVQIEQLGDRFSGLYYVTESTHTISDSGYKTTFKARREEGIA